jgi:hypothetical protein
MSSYSIVIQGFYNDEGGVVVKEIAVVHVETDHLAQHLVMRLPPHFFPHRRRNLREAIAGSQMSSMAYRGVRVLQNTTTYAYRMVLCM